MKEEWKNIKGYNGYMASNLGRIKSFLTQSNGKILKQRYDKDGYKMVWTKYRAGARVHQLVLLAFDPEGYFEGAVVNHKNGDKEKNYLENLEWTTISENTQHAYDTGLAKSAQSTPVELVYNEHVFAIYQSIRHLANHCSLDRNSISECIEQQRTIFDEVYVRLSLVEDIPEELLNKPFCFNPLKRYQSQPLSYNNMFFESIKHLSEYLDINRDKINRAITKNQPINNHTVTKITRYEYINNKTSTTSL